MCKLGKQTAVYAIQKLLMNEIIMTQKMILQSVIYPLLHTILQESLKTVIILHSNSHPFPIHEVMISSNISSFQASYRTLDATNGRLPTTGKQRMTQQRLQQHLYMR